MTGRDRAPGLSIEVTGGGGGATVTLAGELDLACEGSIAEALENVRGADQVVIDLTGLVFVDSTGLRLLLELDRDLSAEGARVGFRLPDGGPVLRLLRLTRLDERLRAESPS